MSHLTYTLAASILAFAGCGGGSETPPDALVLLPDSMPVDSASLPPDAPAVADLSCLGATLPTTASDPVVLTGSAQTINVAAMAIEPVVGADVRAFTTDDDDDDDDAIATATTDANGTYTLEITTRGTPLDGYVHGTSPALRDIYLYPPAPYAASDTSGFLFMLDDQVWGFLSDGREQAGNGSLVVIVIDCAGAPISGATITATQANTDVGITAYADGSQGFPLPGTGAATDASGTAYIFDVPEGATTVSAVAMGMQLRTHVVGSAAQATTTTAIVP